MRGRDGSALLLVIVVLTVFMVLAVILAKIVYNGYASTSFLVQREQAFWLAEAGLEAGKVELSHNLSWYTDRPHYPEDDLSWLKSEAVGERGGLGGGFYKVVRERDKDRFYAIGFKGQAAVILKVKFAAAPLKVLSRNEI